MSSAEFPSPGVPSPVPSEPVHTEGVTQDQKYIAFFKKAIDNLYRDKFEEKPAFKAYELFKQAFAKEFGEKEIFPEKLAMQILGEANRERRVVLEEIPPPAEKQIGVKTEEEAVLVALAKGYTGRLLTSEKTLTLTFLKFVQRNRPDIDPRAHYNLLMTVYEQKREGEILRVLEGYTGELFEKVGEEQRAHPRVIDYVMKHYQQELYPVQSEESIMEAIRTKRDLEVRTFLFRYPKPYFTTGKEGEFDPEFVEKLKSHLVSKKLPSQDDLLPLLQKAHEERKMFVIKKYVEGYLEPYLSKKIVRGQEPLPRPVLAELLLRHYEQKIGACDRQDVIYLAMGIYLETAASHMATQLGRALYNELRARALEMQDRIKVRTTDDRIRRRESEHAYNEGLINLTRDEIYSFLSTLQHSEYSPFFEGVVTALEEALPKDFPELKVTREEIAVEFTQAISHVVFPGDWDHFNPTL